MKTLDWSQYNMTPLTEEVCKELSNEDVKVAVGWIGNNPESVHFGKLRLVGKLTNPVHSKDCYIMSAAVMAETPKCQTPESEITVLEGGYKVWEPDFDWVQFEFNVYDPELPGTRFTNRMHEATLSAHEKNCDFLMFNDGRVQWGQGFMRGELTNTLTEEQKQYRTFERHIADVSREHDWLKQIKDKAPEHKKWIKKNPDEYGRGRFGEIEIPNDEDMSL